MNSNPFGLSTVTPYLIVPNIKELIEFLQAVLGAETRGEVQFRENGKVKHAELSIGDSVVMMGEPMGDFSPCPATLYTYVDNCDETYRLALELGATSVLEPEVFPHGDKYGGIKDLSGNIWWLVTHVGN